MVVASAAAVLLLQVVLFYSICALFYLANKSVCFAKESLPHGKFNLL